MATDIIIDHPVSLLIQVQTSEERIESYTSRIYGTFLIGGTIQATMVLRTQ
jgi:hypothetical protein